MRADPDAELAASIVRLEERMDNSPANELHIAAGEQAKITALRLAKLVEGA
jgi:2-oxo-4-hydroxy-4-carboxy--5-ureidoimidazoline (OHCU) decarboxylase